MKTTMNDRETNLDLKLIDSGDLYLQERDEKQAKFRILSGKPFGYFGYKMAVNLDGIDLEARFSPSKSPTVTFMHVDEWILGRAPWGAKRSGDYLISSMEPSPSAFAQEKWAEIQGDFLRAASAEIIETVNFWDGDAVIQYEKDTGKKAPKGFVRYVQSGILKNYSVVPFGADPNSLKNALMSTNTTVAQSAMFAIQMDTMLRLEKRMNFIEQFVGTLGKTDGAEKVVEKAGDVSEFTVDPIRISKILESIH